MLKLDTFLKERSTIPALYRRCEGRLQYQDTYLLCLVVRMVIIITNGILSVLLFTRLELEKNICYISTIIRSTYLPAHTSTCTRATKALVSPRSL
jgi:hypothetical protein